MGGTGPAWGTQTNGAIPPRAGCRARKAPAGRDRTLAETALQPRHLCWTQEQERHGLMSRRTLTIPQICSFWLFEAWLNSTDSTSKPAHFALCIHSLTNVFSTQVTQASMQNEAKAVGRRARSDLLIQTESSSTPGLSCWGVRLSLAQAQPLIPALPLQSIFLRGHKI